MDTPTTQRLASQVGGHAGVMTTEDGSLLIKPALPRELHFYQALQQDPALEVLREFTPKFLGTLKLEGKVDPAKTDNLAEAVLEPAGAEKDMYSVKSLRDRAADHCVRYLQSLVLENLSFSFLKPNILDVKLGTVLYDETAPPEKVARMEKAARDTTSFEKGIRLTGFQVSLPIRAYFISNPSLRPIASQVYDNITSQPVNTPKAYGKSIKASQLGEGIAKFFPVGLPEAEPSAEPTPSSGLPRETLVPVLRAIREEIEVIREAFASLELRMVGGSLLIIYEADWTRADEAIKQYLEGEEEEDEDEEGDEEEEESSKPKSGPPFTVKLIDFAHTSVVPGKGPDEGVLLGMDTVLNLLDARLAAITP
ncbi:unnamed protein product [Cyclocybe aegerita]|uniref:Kinase n=1 Tax=Cyclocybe aegerita TaxID=1973307 RepID=A0A8S0XFG7_CYCAE|nr:unnamed protein product [Cyclocybe aegerita]